MLSRPRDLQKAEGDVLPILIRDGGEFCCLGYRFMCRREVGLPNKDLIHGTHQVSSAAAPLTPENSFVTCETEDGHVN